MPGCALVLASFPSITSRGCVFFSSLGLNRPESQFLFVILHPVHYWAAIICINTVFSSFSCPTCEIMAITDQITKSFSLWTIMDVNGRLYDRNKDRGDRLLDSNSIWRSSEHMLSILMKSFAGCCGLGPWEREMEMPP